MSWTSGAHDGSIELNVDNGRNSIKMVDRFHKQLLKDQVEEGKRDKDSCFYLCKFKSNKTKFTNEHLVAHPHFESGVSKVQNGNESDLTFHEKLSVKCLLKEKSQDLMIGRKRKHKKSHVDGLEGILDSKPKIRKRHQTTLTVISSWAVLQKLKGFGLWQSMC